MGIFSKLFGGSGRSAEPPKAMSPTEIAVSALLMKVEPAFLDGMAKGLPIDVNDISAGAPMLSIAISHELDKAASVILDRKPNVNLADAQYGMTALHAAVTKRKISLVHRIIAAGADVNKTFGPPNGPRWTALSIAVKNRETGIIVALLEAGAKTDCDMTADAPDAADRGLSPLGYAASAGDLELVRLLITRGANVNHWPPSTMSPLMMAAWNGRLDVAKHLVNNGAIIELQSLKFKANAYDIALNRGHPQLATYLRSKSKTLQSAYPA